jgi:hypothetical protein
VVVLQKGTFTVLSTINVPSGVVLRGQGSSGANATILSLGAGGSGPVVAIGPPQVYDQACYANHFGSSVALTADAVKEQTEISIAANNTTFKAGDYALLDEANDAALVNDGDCGGAFKRVEGRTVQQRVQIASVDIVTGTLTLTDPLHWTFKRSNDARISKVTDPVTTWAGVEHLWVQNGRGLGEWLGRKAGGVDVSSAADCWVKDVQTDGTLDGMHVTLTGTLRCVVRDSHFHNSKVYGFGQDNYGIVLRCGAADNLIENNIARYMNKPILFSNSGGGNVVGYNYADNSWSMDSDGEGRFQEVAIDCHCSYPHMELIEGNYAPHMGASITHGNAGSLTYFRNYASSQQAPDPIVWGLPSASQTGNVTALQFDASDNYMTVVGNVLGSTTNPALACPPRSARPRSPPERERGEEPVNRNSMKRSSEPVPRSTAAPAIARATPLRAGCPPGASDSAGRTAHASVPMIASPPQSARSGTPALRGYPIEEHAAARAVRDGPP